MQPMITLALMAYETWLMKHDGVMLLSTFKYLRTTLPQFQCDSSPHRCKSSPDSAAPQHSRFALLGRFVCELRLRPESQPCG